VLYLVLTARSASTPTPAVSAEEPVPEKTAQAQGAEGGARREQACRAFQGRFRLAVRNRHSRPHLRCAAQPHAPPRTSRTPPPSACVCACGRTRSPASSSSTRARHGCVPSPMMPSTSLSSAEGTVAASKLLSMVAARRANILRPAARASVGPAGKKSAAQRRVPPALLAGAEPWARTVVGPPNTPDAVGPAHERTHGCRARERAPRTPARALHTLPINPRTTAPHAHSPGAFSLCPK
jgi:hypothetical protein